MQKRVLVSTIALAIVCAGAYKFKIYAAHVGDEVVRFDITGQLVKDIAGMSRIMYDQDPEKRLEQFYEIRKALDQLPRMPMRQRQEVFRASIEGKRPLALLIKRLGFTPGEVDKAIIMQVIELLVKAGDQFLPRELQEFENNAVFAPRAAIRILTECDGLKEACTAAIKTIRENLGYQQRAGGGHEDIGQEPNYNTILEYLNEQELPDMKGLIKALQE